MTIFRADITDIFMENSAYRIMIRVGLIDDHALIRKGFTIMLEQLGYTVIIEASHGKEFIHQISEKNQPDIILLDTRLYVMDSFSTLQWIKINYPQIPVIALHSKNDHKSLDKLMKGGAAGYIYKTSTPQEVNRLIKEVLGSNQYFKI